MIQIINTVPTYADDFESLQQDKAVENFSPILLKSRRSYKSSSHRVASCTLPRSRETTSGNGREKPFRITKKRSSNSLNLPKGTFSDTLQKILPSSTLNKEVEIESKETDHIVTEEHSVRQQQDSFFENFESQFVVKFPSPSSKVLPEKNGYSPNRVNKTLIFNEQKLLEARAIPNVIEEITNDSNRRSASVKEENRITSSIHQLLKEVAFFQNDSEIALSSKDTYESVVHTKDYRKHQPLKLESHNDLKAHNLGKHSKLPQTMKLNSRLQLPLGDKKVNRASGPRNESVFANLVSNRTYRDYNQMITHSRANCKDFIDDNWKLFEKTRERLAATRQATQPTNSLLISNNQKPQANDLDKENNVANGWPMTYLDRRRSKNLVGNDQLSEISNPFKTNLLEKENIFISRPQIYDQERYSQEVARLNSRVSENQMGIARVFDYKNKRRATLGQKDSKTTGNSGQSTINQSNLFVLRDLTNRISVNESVWTINTDRSQPSGKEVDQTQQYVPKPAYEILRESRKEYDSRKNSQAINLASRIQIA